TGHRRPDAIRGQDTSGLTAGLAMTDVTGILAAIERGDPHAAAGLLPLVYDELRRLAAAKSPVEMQKFLGAIDATAGGVTSFTLSGTASHLGQFTAYGEVEFVPGEELGSLEGMGVVVFEAANGDLLVGNVAWQVDAGGDLRTCSIHSSWRDSVQFED